MKKSLWKDFLREIWKSKSRFISIYAIVFIGVAFFSGIKATAPDMKHSMDNYYDQYNLMDIRIMSTLGLTDDDISAIENSDGVKHVQTGYFSDVVTVIDSSQLVVKIHSIPKEKEDSINQFKLTKGRYPENPGEAILEDSDILGFDLDIGDTIKVSSGKAEPITDSALALDEFTIVGKGITPYYLTYDKGASEIGSGKVNFFMMVLEDDFIYPAYTEALVTVEGAKQLNSYSKQYDDLVSKSVIPLENIGVDRSAIRLQEVKSMALEELEKGKKEYNEAKAKFDKEIKEAEDELNEAQVQLVEGETTLEVERENFEETFAQASQQIAEGESSLAQAEIQYSQALNQYNEMMELYGEDLARLDSGTQQINETKAQADANLADLNAQLADPELSQESSAEIQQLIGYYNDFLTLVDEGVASINGLNDLGQGSVKNAETQLANARQEIDSQSAQLYQAKRDLESARWQANQEFEAAEKELAQGRLDYEEGKKEFDEQRIKGQQELEEAREEIIRAENEIERLSKPQWYVLDRNSHYSFVDYGKTADRIDAIAKIFPVFFFLVASLVCLTTMTRMVDEQRSIIGAYKALGYSNKDIAFKYVFYAIIASVLGGVLGLYVGMKIFPSVIYNAWSMMYTLPVFTQTPQIPLMILSMLIGVLVTTLSAWGACQNELKETPALLLRPKAPKVGKKILLEKVNFIWKRLSFSHKVTARNLFRYKKRFFMTIIGIAGCSALLLAGFGLSDSIAQVVSNQYNEIITHDISMKLTATATQEDLDRVVEILEDNEQIEAFILGSEYNAKVKSEGNDISATLIIPTDEEAFKSFVTLRDRASQEPIFFPEKGIIINEKLAKELNVSIGDAIELDNGDGARKKVEVADITENYIFHYVYMSQDYFNEIFRLMPTINNSMIKLNLVNSDIESQVGNTLMSDDSVASIQFYSNAKDTIEDTVTIMNSIVIVIIISAGLLAFVVLYNLTNININERIREIATIKVLGFYNREVASYVYRENVLLSLIGAVIGLLIGIVLHRIIMVAIEQDGVMFGYHIDWISFIYAIIITMVFVMFVNIFMYRRLKNIPMVESLKSVE